MRQIVEDARFERERDSLNPNAERMDDILEGVYETLSRDPDRGMQVTSDIWAIGTRFTEPSFLIYYRFCQSQVVLLSIRRQDANGDDGL